MAQLGFSMQIMIVLSTLPTVIALITDVIYFVHYPHLRNKLPGK